MKNLGQTISRGFWICVIVIGMLLLVQCTPGRIETRDGTPEVAANVDEASPSPTHISATDTPVPTNTATGVPTPTATASQTSTPTPTPSSTPSPIPLPTIVEPIRFDWSFEAILAMDKLPSQIRGVVTLLDTNNATERHRLQFEKWLMNLPYLDSPDAIQDISQKLLNGDTLSVEEVERLNSWTETYNQRTAPLVTATAEAIISATATLEALKHNASLGVKCSDIPNSDSRLTSPVASFVNLYAADFAREPLGLIPRTASQVPAIAFELEPDTVIYAPVSGKTYLGWGGSWVDTKWTLFHIENDEVLTMIVLPYYWVTPHWRGTEWEKNWLKGAHACSDCAEINYDQYFDGYVRRGDPIAIYHSEHLPVGGFPASIAIVARNSEERLDMSPGSSMWYEGYPAPCSEWNQ